MIKESKYILRRILIGVGIVLCLSFLNGCKVKALSWSDSDMTEIVSMHSGSYNADFKVYYNSTNNRYYWYNSKSPNNYSRYTENASTYSYIACWWDSINDDRFRCILTDVPLYFYYWGNNRYISPLSSITSVNYAGEVNIITNNKQGNTPGDMAGYENYGIKSNYSVQLLNNAVANPFRASNYDIYHKDNITDLYFQKTSNNIIFPYRIPEFLSFNATPITTNNVITSYIVRPEFSSFDTDNYIYQYSFDNNKWLSLTENEQILRINNNSTIYVRVKDKNTNEYIDSATFTITNIGTFYNQQTYNINFSGDYRTENYLTDNMCVFEGSKSEIKQYQIYIDYVPKSSILKYQYQYVPTDSQLNNNNWLNVSSSDNGAFTYVASENGTLYARILDKEDNVLKTSTFQVSSIGKIAIDDIDQQCTKNIFQKFSSNINYGGPVSSLFVIPVTTLNVLYSSMSNSSTCTPIQLGSLLGTNMQFGCYNFKSIVGNEVYNLIDIIFAFVLSVGVFKFILKLYNDLISMKDIN